MGWLIIIGSIPIVVLGLVFQDQIETVFRSLWLVAIMLIVFGVLLASTRSGRVGAPSRTSPSVTASCTASRSPSR
jgi:undecaprenyl-diphosphatase